MPQTAVQRAVEIQQTIFAFDKARDEERRTLNARRADAVITAVKSEGVPVTALAKAMGIDRQTVYRMLHEHGVYIDGPQKKDTDGQKLKIREGGGV